MALAFLFLTLFAPVASAKKCAPEMCSGIGLPSCPTLTHGLKSEPDLEKPHLENIYFRNGAPHSVELLHVNREGEEVSYGFLSPGLSRGLPTLHGDVWRARAFRPGHPSDQRLLLEHRVGTVQLKDCECPQPSFVDCKKPPFKGPRNQLIDDPVVFENQAALPIDLYWWNGTCEELVSWDEVGGVQYRAQKRILSTQGHSFRVRAAFSGRMLMQHTLSDLVIRSCDQEEATALEGELLSLQHEAWSLEAERDSLREQLAGELSRLLAEMDALVSNTTADTTERRGSSAYALADEGTAKGSSTYAVATEGIARELRAGGLLGTLLNVK